MPDDVIDRVNEMGKANPEGMIFTDREGNPIKDEDEQIIVSNENIEQSIPDQEIQDEPSLEEEGETDAIDSTGAGVNDAPADIDDNLKSTGADENEEENNNKQEETAEEILENQDEEIEFNDNIVDSDMKRKRKGKGKAR